MVDKKRQLRPSILDRLLDDAPTQPEDTTDQRYQTIDALRRSVRRDLETLLNTRHRISPWPEELEALEHSLVNYGLPDLATVNVVDHDSKQRFTQLLEQIIRHFEPRFKDVSVRPLANADERDRSLRFRIEATLYADPMPEILNFNSVLEPVTRTVSLKEADHDG